MQLSSLEEKLENRVSKKEWLTSQGYIIPGFQRNAIILIRTSGVRWNYKALACLIVPPDSGNDARGDRRLQDRN